MRVPLSLPCIALLLSVAPLAPLAAQDGRPAQAAPAAPGKPMPGRMDETNNPADAAYIAAMRDLMVGMHRAMPTGDTDRDYVRMMLPHDQSAVAMARAEVKYGQDPEVKAMAQQVIDEQDRRISAMKAWQEKHPQ